jgi:anaerobic magnesium-protoporphyrin IX monomethyl ester cyclase
MLLLRPPVVEMRTSYMGTRITPPIALASLAASLRAAGHEPVVLDALMEGSDDFRPAYAEGAVVRGLDTDAVLERIADLGRIDAIGVNTMFSQDWPETAKLIAAIGSRFDVPIIVGGEHATAAAQYILDTSPRVTAAAHGEGEDTVIEFADWVAGRKTLENVSGISRRDENGAAVRNETRARIRAVDDIPWPAWDLFDVEKYLTDGSSYGIRVGRTMPIMATRGCPYRCTFCSSPQMWTTKYVTRDPELVLDEIEHYIRTYDADTIDFYDLTAITRRSWILAFCEGIERRGLKFAWQLPSGTRSEALDREVLRAISRAGCTSLSYAPESGSTRTLEIIKKKVNLDKLTDSIRGAVKERISIKVNLIIGFPHETRRDVLATIRYAAKLAVIGIEDAGIYLFSPYPGSELYEELRRDGVLPEMNDAYFATLLQQTDVKGSSVYCRAIGGRELGLYRLGGMLLFYALAYLRRPTRAIRTMRNLITGKEAESYLESRLSERGRTWRKALVKKRAGGAGTVADERTPPRVRRGTTPTVSAETPGPAAGTEQVCCGAALDATSNNTGDLAVADRDDLSLIPSSVPVSIRPGRLSKRS